ncbi:hypothetical protein B0H11DRAFT_1901401 [Mycena galericulata]|nr:hypothetical protein B0H11DRAFT_1901401 [Mycena galericulata]
MNEDSDSSDRYSALLNDGVRVGDDEEESDEEEQGDEPDPANLNHPKPRWTARRLPHWLQSQFDAKVDDSKHRGTDGIPALYRDHHTFWFPVEDPYFATRDISTLEPQNYTTRHFFCGTLRRLFTQIELHVRIAIRASLVADTSHVVLAAASTLIDVFTSSVTDTTALLA